MPGQPRREAAWWGPKDDRALLQGYYKHGGILWAHKAITAAVESIMSDDDLDFTVKVSGTNDKPTADVTHSAVRAEVVCDCSWFKSLPVQSLTQQPSWVPMTHQ